MRTTKLDDRRDVTESGWIIQRSKAPGSNAKEAGAIWQPPAMPSDGRRRVTVRGKQMPFARALWVAFNGPIPEGIHVDHINGDRSDDRLCNLRLATVSENNRAHKAKSPGGSSKYRGVSWSKKDKRWLAQIAVNSKTQHIGSYHTEKTAAIARDLAAYDAGYANEGLNFPIGA